MKAFLKSILGSMAKMIGWGSYFVFPVAYLLYFVYLAISVQLDYGQVFFRVFVALFTVCLASGLIDFLVAMHSCVMPSRRWDVRLVKVFEALYTYGLYEKYVCEGGFNRILLWDARQFNDEFTTAYLARQ